VRMMRNETAPVRLRDYRVPDFLIDKTELDLKLDPLATRVTARLAMRRNPAADGGGPLILVGDELNLVSVAIDGTLMPADSYEATSERLSIAAVPKGAFSLEIVTEAPPLPSGS
jgi:aminopeptidase N